MVETGGRMYEVLPSSSDSLLNNASSSDHSGLPTIFARAKHAFKGRNNDELSFRKGDVITVTQQLEGGWWEGTLHANTGWFPSNYVTIISESERFLRSKSNGSVVINGHKSSLGDEDAPLLSNDSSRRAYRQQVINNFLEAERLYVNAITDFYNNLLLKIGSAKLISDEDFRTLSGNIQLLVVEQSEILENIQEAVEKDATNARIGGYLLRSAPILRQLLSSYCENHPRAVDLVLRNKNEFEKILSQSNCQLKHLISGLSRPFRHLDTYPSKLTELERGMHEAHPDRGDTRRSAAVFREIADHCANIRKQREMQLELVSSGVIDGLTSRELSELGQISHMGIISVDDFKAPSDEELSCDRCIVLFPSVLLILEITPNVNSYVLKKKVELSGMTLKKPENKSALQLYNADDVCQISLNMRSNEELQIWLESLGLYNDLTIHESCSTLVTCNPSAQQLHVTSVHSVAEISPLRRAKISQLPAAVKADNAKRAALPPGFRLNHQLEMLLPEGLDENDDTKTTIPKHSKMYSGYCLRPYPAARGNYAVDYSIKANVKLRKEVGESDHEDAFLLRIIEGYCTASIPSKRSLAGIQSNRINEYQPPQLIVADDEKIFVEEMVGDEVVVTEKSLVDTVYALKDQLSEIQKEFRQLNKTVDREQKARRRLEEMVRRIGLQSSASAPKLNVESETPQ